MIIKQFDTISCRVCLKTINIIELYGYTGDNRIHNENEIPENITTLHKKFKKRKMEKISQ